MKTKLLFLSFSVCGIINAQGVWTQKADFPGLGRISSVGFSIGTKGYVGTGRTGQYPNYTTYKDFWEWDQTTNVWTQKTDFEGIARGYAVGFSIGNKGYIGTGGIDFGWGPYYKDFWEFDPATNTWIQKADYTGGKYTGWGAFAASGFSIGTKGYIGKGYDNSGYDTLYEWDGDTTSITYNTWIKKSAPLAEFVSSVEFSIGNKGYMGTGYTFPPNSFWEWDQATDVWTQKANFGGTERTGASGFSIGTKGYIGTGFESLNGYIRDFWEWTQGTNTWTQIADFGGITRSGAVGFSIGTKGYIGLGETWSNSYRKDFWEFDPNGNGISENENAIEIIIYPNPFTTQASLVLPQEVDLSEQPEFRIYDMYGSETTRVQVAAYRAIINRDNLPSGMYFCKVVSNNAIVATGKFIIQ